MKSRWMVAAALVAGVWSAGAPAVAQQSDADWLARCREQRDSRPRYCEVRPVSLTWGGSLNVDARPNGGVRVTGSDQAGVTGSARIEAQADSEADARSIVSSITIDTSSGSLRAVGPKTEGRRSWSVGFVLSAPRRGDLQVDTVNGPVHVAGITGRIRLTATNGPLTLDSLGGDVQARATNGPIKVTLAGTAWEGQGLDVETTNGPVTLSMPDGYSAQLEAGTTHGPLRSDIPVTVQGDRWYSRRSVDATIGGGGARIRAVTTNGPVSIVKR